MTELLPEKHQDEIDAAANVEDTYESYLIQRELYDMILAAPRTLQSREIEELPAPRTL